MRHCIVGDVHGEYTALLNLVGKIPAEDQIIFVGDLVDRGTQSAHVIQFIRKNNFSCVRGNHEEMMIEYGSKFIHAILNEEPIDQENVWLKHGGIETLLSYGLIYVRKRQLVPHPYIKEFIDYFKDDIAWMKELPLYLVLDAKHHSGRPVVVSHSAISSVWDIRHQSDKESIFSKTVLWSRKRPDDQAEIFNIFGHTPQRYHAETEAHYVNIDTGCYMREQGYGLLSAYCVESAEIYSSSSLPNQLSA